MKRILFARLDETIEISCPNGIFEDFMALAPLLKVRTVPPIKNTKRAEYIVLDEASNVMERDFLSI